MLSSVALLKPNHQTLLPGYLKYWLNSPDTLSMMLDKMTGTAIRRLTLTTISAQMIPIAPLPEQRRIVAKVDGLTARTARARKELDRIPTLIARYKQRLLALAYSGELTAGWRADQGKREPVLKTIDELAEGLRYGTAQKCYVEPNGVAVLRIKPEVFDSIINKTPLSYRTNRIIGGVAPSEYLGKLEKGNTTTPPIAPDKLDTYLRTHLLDPALLRAGQFEAFMEDRQKRLLGLIEQAMGKSAYTGNVPEEGEDNEATDDQAEATLLLPVG